MKLLLYILRPQIVAQHKNTKYKNKTTITGKTTQQMQIKEHISSLRAFTIFIVSLTVKFLKFDFIPQAVPNRRCRKRQKKKQNNKTNKCL